MIEVRKKPKESIESMLRRFSELLQKDKKLERAKEIRFYQRPKSRKRIKKETLLRRTYQEKMGYLEKIGKIKRK